MVPRENKNNACAKFWRTNKSGIMVFLKVAYAIKGIKKKNNKVIQFSLCKFVKLC